MLLSVFILLIAAITAAHFLCSPPRKLTVPNPDVPVVPFWVALLPLLRRWFGLPALGQDKVYERYVLPRLRPVGAAWIFFGGRWNLLVQDPVAIKQVLSRFEKSGNHIKIPASVIAQLTGSNIISEHGMKWRRYRNAIAAPLSSTHLDVDEIKKSMSAFFSVLDNSPHRICFRVNPLLQRLSMDILCRLLFKRDLGFLSQDSPPAIHATHTLVKKHIFDPFFLSFPFFDEEPWVRLFPQRKVARGTVKDLEVSLVKALLPDLKQGSSHSSVVDAMCKAVEQGDWTEQELIDNLKILFIAGHENTQQALNSLLYMLAVHQKEQDDLRSAVQEQRMDNPDQHQVAEVQRFVLETLRLLPPIPQLFNRRASQDEVIKLRRADGRDIVVHVPVGTYAGWTAYGAHRRSLDGDTFQPSRWGSTISEIQSTLRREKAEARFLTFHWGQRSCIGFSLAMFELQFVVVELLQRYSMTFPDTRTVQNIDLSPGGLLAPVNLDLCFTPLKSRTDEDATAMGV